MDIRILLVDDEPLLIESLEIILNNEKDFNVVGLMNNGMEALKFLENNEVDVMLIDLNMPVMGGIELISEVKKKKRDIKIVVLTTFYDNDNISQALKNGADGYILKDSGKDAIINAISQAVNGNGVLDHKVMQKLTGMLADSEGKEEKHRTMESEKINSSVAEIFTSRELEIAKLIADGLTNSQIASVLFISEGTVKNYVSNIYDKTNIHDRAKLVVYLREGC